MGKYLCEYVRSKWFQAISGTVGELNGDPAARNDPTSVTLMWKLSFVKVHLPPKKNLVRIAVQMAISKKKHT